jgi:molybdenum cofactor biosynthesis protein A
MLFKHIQTHRHPNIFPNKLIDNHGRVINYLRLAVTDRCNLRCVYCMPKDPISFLLGKKLLTLQELERIIAIFTELGITKIRFTGGEPFVRQDFMDLFHEIKKINKQAEVHITTNGVLTATHILKLKKLGLAGINLSLDTLRKDRFLKITGSDHFDAVRRTMRRAIKHDIPLKINTVIMEFLNTDEIHPISQLAKEHPVEVRFIEKMPFDGRSGAVRNYWTAPYMLRILRQMYSGMVRINKPNSTATVFRIPGFHGRVGIIGGYSRTFCQDCNRIRITPSGILKTCLYDRGVLDLKKMLRNGFSDLEIKSAIHERVMNRPQNGIVAEMRTDKVKIKHSMACIGG